MNAIQNRDTYTNVIQLHVYTFADVDMTKICFEFTGIACSRGEFQEVADATAFVGSSYETRLADLGETIGPIKDKPLEGARTT